LFVGQIHHNGRSEKRPDVDPLMKSDRISNT